MAARTLAAQSTAALAAAVREALEASAPLEATTAHQAECKAAAVVVVQAAAVQAQPLETLPAAQEVRTMRARAAAQAAAPEGAQARRAATERAAAAAGRLPAALKAVPVVGVVLAPSGIVRTERAVV